MEALKGQHSMPISSTTETVLSRHSTRSFSKKPVPLGLVEESLQLAQRAPSSTNLQPWRLTLVSGAALHRLTTVLTETFQSGAKLDIAEIPPSFQHYRSELGKNVYGPNGYNIPRDDVEAQMKAVLQNFEFYGAPLVGIVAISKELTDADTLSVGIWLSTLVLLLTERGLGTQLSVSTTGYQDKLRGELGIADDLNILCTIGIGYEKDNQPINKLKMPRDSWTDSVRFITE